MLQLRAIGNKVDTTGTVKLELKLHLLSDSQTNFSTMKRGMEPLRRPPKRQEVSNFKDILAQIQHSGIIYFVESLPKIAIQTLKTQKTATLTLPTQFIRENRDKIEQWVILRAHSPCGGSARTLVVQLSVSARSPGIGKIRIGGGLYSAIADNRLREGDSLIFVPQEDARLEDTRLEFEVYMFRGTQEFPLFPDEGDNASTHEENHNTQSSLAFHLHQQNEHKQAVLTSDIRRVGKAIPLQYVNHVGPHVGFCKQLTASNIGRSDRHLLSNSGQFEFPADFIRTHGQQIQASVKFQGIHEDSPIRVITCRRRWSANKLRLSLLVTQWSKFVTENGLKFAPFKWVSSPWSRIHSLEEKFDGGDLVGLGSGSYVLTERRALQILCQTLLPFKDAYQGNYLTTYSVSIMIVQVD